jgi:hypothetical protein
MFVDRGSLQVDAREKEGGRRRGGSMQ